MNGNAEKTSHDELRPIYIDGRAVNSAAWDSYVRSEQNRSIRRTKLLTLAALALSAAEGAVIVMILLR